MERNRNESLGSRAFGLLETKHPPLPAPDSPPPVRPHSCLVCPLGPVVVWLSGAPSSWLPGGRPVHPNCRTGARGTHWVRNPSQPGTQRGSDGAAERCHPRGRARLRQRVGALNTPQRFPAPWFACLSRRGSLGLGWGDPGSPQGAARRGAGGGHRPQVPWPQAPRCRTMTGGLCSLSERRLAARSWHRLA